MCNYGRVEVVDGKLSKSAWLIYAVACIFIGFLVLFDEEEFEGGFDYVLVIAYIGFGIIAFFAYVATTFRPRRLVADEKGIVITELFSLRKQISWEDIDSFSLYKSYGKNEVVRVWERVVLEGEI
jgi:hypothetical protein